MIEKIGHIKNPLSVIAIFAAIAEISGTTVLPFIEPSNQSTYIWFLMIFPLFLVGAFFITLNFNHKVLYAPSDYKDEEHFVSSFRKANPAEQSQKLNEEVEEIEADQTTKPEIVDSAIPALPQDSKKSSGTQLRKRQIMADLALAEKLAINSLEENLGLDLKTNVKFNLGLMDKSETSESSSKLNIRMNVIFDAAHVSEKSVQAVEIKLFKTGNIDKERFRYVLNMAEKVSSQCEDIKSKSFTLHIFAVIDAAEIDAEDIKRQLQDTIKSSEIEVVVHAASLNDLQNANYYSPNQQIN